MEISKEELQNQVGRLSRKENKAVANNSASQRGDKAKRCQVCILSTQKSSSNCAYLKGSWTHFEIYKWKGKETYLTQKEKKKLSYST